MEQYRRALWILVALVALLAGCGPRSQPLQAGYSLSVDVEQRSWRLPDATGRVLKTAGYATYTTSNRRVLLRVLPGFLEASRANYLSITGLPEQPATPPYTVYLFGTRNEWERFTRYYVRRNLRTYLAIQAGGYFYPSRGGACVYWDIGGFGVFSVAAHEGLHQFLHRRLTDRLPLSVEEGLCTLTEGYELNGSTVRFTPSRNLSRMGSLRDAILSGKQMPLRKLLTMDAGQALESMPLSATQYYGQVWALATFLRYHPTYGPKLLKMIADAREGTLHEAIGLTRPQYLSLLRQGRSYTARVAGPLVEHYFTTDWDRLEREYAAHARTLAGVK